MPTAGSRATRRRVQYETAREMIERDAAVMNWLYETCRSASLCVLSKAGVRDAPVPDLGWHDDLGAGPARTPTGAPTLSYARGGKRKRGAGSYCEGLCARTTPPRTLARLRDLIAALDRRLPRVESLGEVSIARAAAALREEACRRIAELEAGDQS